jgi:hypothetical protein
VRSLLLRFALWLSQPEGGDQLPTARAMRELYAGAFLLDRLASRLLKRGDYDGAVLAQQSAKRLRRAAREIYQRGRA